MKVSFSNRILLIMSTQKKSEMFIYVLKEANTSLLVF